jgi:DNA repair protein RadC
VRSERLMIAITPRPITPRPCEDLTDADLLAILLGGTAEAKSSTVAAKVLDRLGGVAGLCRAGTGELAAYAGVGAARGARVSAAIELGRRASSQLAALSTLGFPNSAAVAAWATPRLTLLDHEELWALALDGRNRLRGARRVAMGGLHGLHVSPRDPLRIALREGASSFILVHNHPSGDPTPSFEDIAFTERIVDAAEVVATPLVDHVVVARSGHVSLLEKGLMTRPARRPP